MKDSGDGIRHAGPVGSADPNDAEVPENYAGGDFKHRSSLHLHGGERPVNEKCEWRGECPTVIALQQKFLDFLERYEKNQAETKEWRAEMTRTVNDTADTVKELKALRGMGFWVAVTFFGSLIIAAATAFVEWVRKHF